MRSMDLARPVWESTSIRMPQSRVSFSATSNGVGTERSAYQVRIHSSALNEYLSSTFQIEPTTGAATKRIPAPFFRSPKSVLAALLSGLIDGDGSVHVQRNVINYGTISEALADGIQLLLQHLGVLTHRFRQAPTDRVINGRSVKSKHPLFALEANGRYAQQLAQMLTLAHEQKRERLQRIRAARLKVTRYDRVPYAAATLFKELSDHHLGGGWYRDTQGRSFRQGIAYATGTKIRYSRRLRHRSLGRTQLVDGGISAKLKRIGSRRAPAPETRSAVTCRARAALKVSARMRSAANPAIENRPTPGIADRRHLMSLPALPITPLLYDCQGPAR